MTIGKKPIIKSLVRSSNNGALIIDQSILKIAGLNEDKTRFKITIKKGRILISSIGTKNTSSHMKAFRKTLSENDALMKRLSEE